MYMYSTFNIMLSRIEGSDMPACEMGLFLEHGSHFWPDIIFATNVTMSLSVLTAIFQVNLG